MNPPPRSAAQRAEPDTDNGPQPDQSDNAASEIDRFTDLTRKLLGVPKAALDERRSRPASR